ncbi:hypothetical protein WME97_30115 [Sorangium sp. So ce367]|uniref:hypothetical protein n=1 Tax=Sorangium sp. So ce367 TaxID=3133305 RepID=UPI003F5DA9B8
MLDQAASRQLAEAASHHKKIAELASAEFPGYELAYVIEYGVYGLASAIASE